MKPKSKILIIAGSDSSGGAGIQADIKTVTALGSYAMTAITAVTSQNTTGVKSVIPIKPKEIEKQIEFSCIDIKPDAVKIGMLHSSKVILSIIKSLKKFKIKKIILDPVMFAKGGTNLINSSAIKTLKSKLLKNEDFTSPSRAQSISVNEPVTAPWYSAKEILRPVGFTFFQFSSSKHEKTHHSKPSIPTG